MIQHIAVLKSHSRNPKTAHVVRPLLVMLHSFVCEVMGAIEFDYKIFSGTIKISDVASDAVLSSEFSAVELFSFQQ